MCVCVSALRCLQNCENISSLAAPRLAQLSSVTVVVVAGSRVAA